MKKKPKKKIFQTFPRSVFWKKKTPLLLAWEQKHFCLKENHRMKKHHQKRFHHKPQDIFYQGRSLLVEERTSRLFLFQRLSFVELLKQFHGSVAFDQSVSRETLPISAADFTADNRYICRSNTKNSRGLPKRFWANRS